MAHTTSIYYRDRLGFEPDSEPHRQYSSGSRLEQSRSEMSSSSRQQVQQQQQQQMQQHATTASSSHSHVASSSSTSTHRMTRQEQSNSMAGGHTSLSTSGNGTNGHETTTVARMESRSVTGGHYEENLNKFKGS
jgi:hypothetical protein